MVAFGLVVGEGHGEVAGEAQDLLVAVAEPLQQVAGLALFAAVVSWVGGQPAPHGVRPAVEQRAEDLRRDLRQARRWARRR